METPKSCTAEITKFESNIFFPFFIHIKGMNTTRHC